MRNDQIFRFSRGLQHGVTSIEYALIATLIAIAIIVGARAAGEANEVNWNKVVAAVHDALGH